MKKFLIGSLIAVTALAGCASNSQKFDLNSTYDSRSPLDIVSQESQKAVNAQLNLTKYKRTEAQLLNIINADLENDKIVIDHIGKPEVLLNSVAIKYGYRFLQFGVPSELPTVNFTKVYTTPMDLLLLVDSQIGEHGSVGIDKSQKLITLTYK